MQARVDALREALRGIAKLRPEVTHNAPFMANDALTADDLLNDEETDE